MSACHQLQRLCAYPTSRRVRISGFSGPLSRRTFDGCTGEILPEDASETAHGLQSVKLDGEHELVITVPIVCLRPVYEGQPT